MKSIQVKILVTIFVITVALCSSITRETTKAKTAVKTATKSDGSGSYTTQYDCPYISIKDLTTNAVTKTGRWSFKANTVGDMHDGLELVMTDGLNSDALKNIVMTNAPGGITYIPWRYFSTDEIDYEKLTNSYKQIIFNVRTDSQQRYEVTLAMPWALMSSYITETQCLSLIKSFQGKRDTIRQEITSLKTTITTATLKLMNILQNQSKLLKGEKAIVESATAKLAELKAARPALEKSESTIQSQIDAKLIEIDGLLKQKAALVTENTKISNEIERDSLMMNDDARKKKIAEAGNELPKFQKLIDDEITTIKTIASDPSSKTNADNAKKNAIAYQADEMNANLDKIYSNTQ